MSQASRDTSLDYPQHITWELWKFTLLRVDPLGGQFYVDMLVIPEQNAISDYWKTTDEAEIGEFCALNPSLQLLGTVHTHPGFTARPSSVDLHQQFDIQLQQPSAIGIIVAPERRESPSYTITPYSMSKLRECATVGETVNGGC